MQENEKLRRGLKLIRSETSPAPRAVAAIILFALAVVGSNILYHWTLDRIFGNDRGSVAVASQKIANPFADGSPNAIQSETTPEQIRIIVEKNFTDPKMRDEFERGLAILGATVVAIQPELEKIANDNAKSADTRRGALFLLHLLTLADKPPSSR